MKSRTRGRPRPRILSSLVNQACDNLKYFGGSVYLRQSCTDSQRRRRLQGELPLKTEFVMFHISWLLFRLVYFVKC